MGTDKVIFEEEQPELTGSNVSHVTGSDITGSHVTFHVLFSRTHPPPRTFISRTYFPVLFPRVFFPVPFSRTFFLVPFPVIVFPLFFPYFFPPIFFRTFFLVVVQQMLVGGVLYDVCVL